MRAARSRPRLAALLGLVLLCAAALTIVLLSGGSPENSSASRDRALAAQATTTYRSQPGLRIPKIDVYVREPGLAPGSIFLGAKRRSGTLPTGVLIADDAGQPVWFRPNPKGMRANDFRVQRYKGKPVLTWWEGEAKGGYGYGEGVIADTSYRVIKRVRTGKPYRMDMHEFKLTDRGTALVIAYRPTRTDMRSVGGSRRGRIMDNVVQEIDVATGKVLFSWRALGNIALREGYRKPKGPKKTWDYFHANSVDVDRDGNYIVSARYSNSVVKISRRTGRVVWRLGGKRSDFKMGKGTRFSLAHDAQWEPDGTLRVFDNSEKRVRDRSRVIWLRVDSKRKRVTLVREREHPKKVLAATQANAQALPDGHLFVGWGSQGRMSEFDESGRLVYDAELPDGYDSYRAYRAEWVGRPATKPSVAASTGADGAITVYASWNGATEVASWRVLSGPGPDALSAVGAAPRKGFETSVAVPGGGTHVAAQALAADGTVLGTSKPVRVSAG